MLLSTEETIVAIASPPGGALRGIVRISGPDAIACAAQWFLPSDDGLALVNIRRTIAVAGNARLDELRRLPGDLYVWPSTRSYTRQPTVEFHTLGSPPLLNLIVQLACRGGVRLAQPGEFTLRAFLAGRMDLTQAEAVLGVIDAPSQRELSVALRQLAGGLAGPLAGLRGSLLDLLAHLEAGLDFVEEDIEFISHAELVAQLASALETVQKLATQMHSRGTGEEVFRVALYGLPNAGKSSLLNALAGEAKAIVSSIAGTTRDYLTARIDCEDIAVELIDTAGVDEASSAIEAAAQSLGAVQISDAHLRILCVDASREWTEWERTKINEASSQLVVYTKCDAAKSVAATNDAIATSARTGKGLSELRRAIALRVVGEGGSGEVVSGTAARCRESLDRARVSLGDALHVARVHGGEELIAAELRIALDELGRVAGAVVTDDILDRIFSRFCIGK